MVKNRVGLTEMYKYKNSRKQFSVKGCGVVKQR